MTNRAQRANPGRTITTGQPTTATRSRPVKRVGAEASDGGTVKRPKSAATAVSRDSVETVQPHDALERQQLAFIMRQYNVPPERALRVLNIARVYRQEEDRMASLLKEALKTDLDNYPRGLPDLRQLEDGGWWNEPGAL